MRARTVLITAAAVVAGAVLLLVALVVGSRTNGSGAEAWGPNGLRPGGQGTSTPVPTLPPMRLGPNVEYVALGDSYAAGMGAGGDRGRCRRSPDRSYPAVFAKASRVKLVQTVACAGATTDDLLADQLGALSSTTDLVSVSIGGNDLGVADLADSCGVHADAECQQYFADALTTLQRLPSRLVTTYRAIADAAPNARIVVTGYTPLFAVPKPGTSEFDTVTAVNTATVGLDSVIRVEVDKLRATGVPISFVDVDFGDHRVGSRSPWLHETGVDRYHPTATGYREYARELRQALTH